MEEPRDIDPFSGNAISFDWKRVVGLVTLAPIRVVILTLLLLLAWLNSRIGEHFQTLK